MTEVRQARYFVAVAEELHFGRAAERLRMSQPPLSQAILQLERQVGARLLERSKRSVALTAAGAEFLDACYSLIRQADRASEIPRMVADGRIGRLRIGAVTSAFDWPLPEILTSLRLEHPGVLISAEEIDSHEAGTALLERRLDVAFVRLAAPTKGVRSLPLTDDHFVVALPANHPLAEGTGAINLAQLADDTWIWLPRRISPDYHDAMAATCRHFGFSPEATHWARSVSSQLAMVGCELGVTLIPAAAAAAAGNTIRTRPLRYRSTGIGLSLLVRTQDDPLNGSVLAIAGEAVRARHLSKFEH